MSPTAPPAPVGRCLTVCADDFGASLATSRGIVALARQGRVQAVSCLTTSPHWPACAPLLDALPAGVSRGLHFNLSEGRPLSPALRALWPVLPALPVLMLRAAFGRLPRAALAEEWRAQWQAFVAATGRAPDHVDGHQHVHALPGVRDLVLAAIQAEPHPPVVRSTGDLRGPGDAFKRGVIMASGGRALARRLRHDGLRHNRVLLGAYGFDTADYRGRMRRWLGQVPAEGAWLFCHPGDPDATPEPADPIGQARRLEARYLASDAFSDDLRAAGVCLGISGLERSSGG